MHIVSGAYFFYSLIKSLLLNVSRLSSILQIDLKEFILVDNLPISTRVLLHTEQ